MHVFTYRGIQMMTPTQCNATVHVKPNKDALLDRARCPQVLALVGDITEVIQSRSGHCKQPEA